MALILVPSLRAVFCAFRLRAWNRSAALRLCLRGGPYITTELGKLDLAAYLCNYVSSTSEDKSPMIVISGLPTAFTDTPQEHIVETLGFNPTPQFACYIPFSLRFLAPFI